MNSMNEEVLDRVCLYCNSNNIIKIGKTLNGKQRYGCKICEKTFSEGQKITEIKSYDDIENENTQLKNENVQLKNKIVEFEEVIEKVKKKDSNIFAKIKIEEMMKR